jgi:hypothetical protein
MTPVCVPSRLTSRDFNDEDENEEGEGEKKIPPIPSFSYVLLMQFLSSCSVPFFLTFCLVSHPSSVIVAVKRERRRGERGEE